MQIEGDNRPGLGHAIATALAEAGINIDFLLGQVSGARHTMIIGFESREDAERATPVMKRAAAAPRRPDSQKPARRRTRGATNSSRRATRRRR